MQRKSAAQPAKVVFIVYCFLENVLKKKELAYEKCWCAVINSIFIPQKQFLESFMKECEYMTLYHSRKKVSFVHIQNAIKINHFSVSFTFLSSVVANFPHLMEHHHSSLFCYLFSCLLFLSHIFFVSLIHLFIYLSISNSLRGLSSTRLNAWKVSFTFNVYFCMSFEKIRKNVKERKG